MIMRTKSAAVAGLAALTLAVGACSSGSDKSTDGGVFEWGGASWGPAGSAQTLSADDASRGFCGLTGSIPGQAQVTEYVPHTPVEGDPKAELIVFTTANALNAVTGELNTTPDCVVVYFQGDDNRAAFERVLHSAPKGDTDRWWVTSRDGQVSAFRVSYPEQGSFATPLGGDAVDPVWSLLDGIPVVATGTPLPNPVPPATDDDAQWGPADPHIPAEDVPDLDKAPTREDTADDQVGQEGP